LPALRVTQEEMAAAWKALDPALRDALATAAEADSRICRAANAEVVE
jgi:histidinol dehydrogenase